MQNTPFSNLSPAVPLIIHITGLQTLMRANLAIVQVTKLKLEQKQAEGIAEARSGRRAVVGSHSIASCSRLFTVRRSGPYDERTKFTCDEWISVYM